MKLVRLLLAISLTLTIAAAASATVVLSDNFDSYVSQAGFQAAWPATVGAGGSLSSAQAQTAPSSINFGTAALRNDRSYTETGNPSAANNIRFSFDFFDTNAAASPYRQISSMIDGAGSAGGQLVSMGMNNNELSTESGGNYFMARILGFTATTVDPDGGPNEAAGGTTVASSFFKLNDFAAAPVRSTGWHNLKVEIAPNAVTSANLDYTFYVDGIKSELVTVTGPTLRSFDIVRLGSGITSTTAMFIDNVLVETFVPSAVPEASSFLAVALVGLVAGGAKWYRRQRAA